MMALLAVLAGLAVVLTVVWMALQGVEQISRSANIKDGGEPPQKERKNP